MTNKASLFLKIFNANVLKTFCSHYINTFGFEGHSTMNVSIYLAFLKIFLFLFQQS